MENNVKRIIDQWDPMHLFPNAPSDEYSAEIGEICNFLKKTREYTLDDLGQGVLVIFQSAFGRDVFPKSFEQCRAIAVKIIHETTKAQ
jgi:hypothetical protein